MVSIQCIFSRFCISCLDLLCNFFVLLQPYHYLVLWQTSKIAAAGVIFQDHSFDHITVLLCSLFTRSKNCFPRIPPLNTCFDFCGFWCCFLMFGRKFCWFFFFPISISLRRSCFSNEEQSTKLWTDKWWQNDPGNRLFCLSSPSVLPSHFCFLSYY